MKFKIIDLILIIIIIISFVIGIVNYDKLPDKVASHWNSKGEVDGYMNKFLGTFLAPFILMFLYLLFKFLPKIDPLKQNVTAFRYEFNTFITILLLFLLYIHVLLIYYNVGYEFNLAKLLIPAFVILIYYTGILIRRSKRNWFIGIKTPWTLSDDYVWNRTHKIGGNLFKLSAVLILISFIFFFNLTYFVLLVTIILSAVIAVIYSYFEYKKIENNKK